MLTEHSTLKLYVHGLDTDVASGFAEVVNDPDSTDVIILNLDPPGDPDYGKLIGLNLFREGRLYYTDEEIQTVLELLSAKPTVVTTYLERLAILTKIVDRAGVVLVNFGAMDQGILDVIFGNFNPERKLPFDISSDRESVLNQKEDVPFDLENLLFCFGHGLSYK